ncbi:MAG: hypothetical protein ACQEVA_13365 [Myxococcota bacterium]
MVFKVRCFKCGDEEARLILGGREIIHARCHACDANLLAEVLELEQEVLAEQDDSSWDEPTTNTGITPLDDESSSLDEETKLA